MRKEERGKIQGLEQRLARIFGLGLSAAILFLAIGVLIPVALWLGIATLMLVPLVGAMLVWSDTTVERATRVSIALAILGIVLAASIGLFLRR